MFVVDGMTSRTSNWSKIKKKKKKKKVGVNLAVHTE